MVHCNTNLSTDILSNSGSWDAAEPCFRIMMVMATMKKVRRMRMRMAMLTYLQQLDARARCKEGRREQDEGRREGTERGREQKEGGSEGTEGRMEREEEGNGKREGTEGGRE